MNRSSLDWPQWNHSSQRVNSTATRNITRKDVITVQTKRETRSEAKNAEIEFPVNAIPQIIDFLKQTYDNTKTTTVS